ncbi:MAG: maleylacetoacetate isomerase [Pseudomonadota bacterium]
MTDERDPALPRLWTYWRSTAAYRVRIALNLKGIDYESVPVDLVRDGGQQRAPDYLAVNPQGLIPALAIDGQVLTQSTAIIEYLEDAHPWPALLPARPLEKARVRAIAATIACDVHPLNNLRVLQYLSGPLGVTSEARQTWYENWIAAGFQALEARLCDDPATGKFCHGDQPGLADILLVAQMYNAHRFKCDVSAYPTLNRIEASCLALPAFDAARPENQPEAPS